MAITGYTELLRLVRPHVNSRRGVAITIEKARRTRYVQRHEFGCIAVSIDISKIERGEAIISGVHTGRSRP
jgi:hypothetical protein